MYIILHIISDQLNTQLNESLHILHEDVQLFSYDSVIHLIDKNYDNCLKIQNSTHLKMYLSLWMSVCLYMIFYIITAVLILWTVSNIQCVWRQYQNRVVVKILVLNKMNNWTTNCNLILEAGLHNIYLLLYLELQSEPASSLDRTSGVVHGERHKHYAFSF